jgi:uncharacterized protein (TIGR04255 family)
MIHGMSPRQRRHYEKAPIVEAVIDIQVEVSDPSKTDSVARLADRLKNEFGTRIPVRQLHMGFKVDPEGGSEFSKSEGILGWRLDNQKKDRVLQLKSIGFTYSHLAPYSDWTTFSTEAEALWNDYVYETGATRVRRTAVRVINRLPKIPEGASINEYLQILPLIPESLPRRIDSMFLQVRMPFPSAHPNANASIGLYSAEEDPNVPILDIDLFVQQPTPVGKEVFGIVNLLGDAKDEIFEACITDKIRELIT